MAFCLLGFGFGGFGQLRPSSEDGRSTEVPVAVEERGDTLVCLGHKLMAFSSKPCIQFSSAWDSMHISAACSGSWYSYTTGRWSEVIQRVKPGTKAEGGVDYKVVLRVTEVQDTILLWTSSHLLAGDPNHPHRLQASSLPQSLRFLPLSGKLFAAALDSGKVHQCELATPTELSIGPCIANLQLPITQVCCGTDHVLILGSSGVVYSFGVGSRGQLGHGNVLPKKEPCLIEALAGVAMKSVACGNWHSMTLSEYGDIYSWGWNEHCQLGHSSGTRGPVAKTVALPTLVDVEAAGYSECNFISISCGSRHSAAVADNGVVYTWGWNGYGQLGCRPLGGPILRTPSPMSLGEGILATEVYCGPWNTVVLCKLSIN